MYATIFAIQVVARPTHVVAPQRSHPRGARSFLASRDMPVADRLEALQDYLGDVLARPGYARHSAMRLFLELDKFDE